MPTNFPKKLLNRPEPARPSSPTCMPRDWREVCAACQFLLVPLPKPAQSSRSHGEGAAVSRAEDAHQAVQIAAVDVPFAQRRQSDVAETAEHTEEQMGPHGRPLLAPRYARRFERADHRHMYSYGT